jgi:hypothetical protein
MSLNGLILWATLALVIGWCGLMLWAVVLDRDVLEGEEPEDRS